MSASDIAVAGLLVVVVVGAAFSSLGVLLARDFYERLHFMTPVATLGVWALAAAVLLKESVSQAGIKVILIALLISFGNAVESHITARAGRAHEDGELKLRPEEKKNRAGALQRRRDAA